jgi:hypothetical protein
MVVGRFLRHAPVSSRRSPRPAPLVPLLMSRRVVPLTADTATIESKSGARLTYRRHQLGGGVVPPWDLVEFSSSPGGSCVRLKAE